MSKREIPSRYKIIIVGEASVGKTSLLRKFTENIFEYDIMSTIGIDYAQKDILVDDRIVRLQIWDTAGQERFHSITKSYYRESNAIALVFSLSDEKSFDCIDRWIKNIDEEVEHIEKIPVVLVGNKNDESEKYKIENHILENKINELNEKRINEGKEELKLFRTSAKSGENVEDLFIYIAEKLVETKDEKKESVFNLQNLSKKKGGGCC